MYFESVSEEILALQNCGIWYKTEDTEIDGDLFADLEQMQVFALSSVTTEVLVTENAALNQEFPCAIEHHIPVLPLMQEKNLDELFIMKCEDGYLCEGGQYSDVINKVLDHFLYCFGNSNFDNLVVDVQKQAYFIICRICVKGGAPEMNGIRKYYLDETIKEVAKCIRDLTPIVADYLRAKFFGKRGSCILSFEKNGWKSAVDVLTNTTKTVYL